MRADFYNFSSAFFVVNSIVLSAENSQNWNACILSGAAYLVKKKYVLWLKIHSHWSANNCFKVADKTMHIYNKELLFLCVVCDNCLPSAFLCKIIIHLRLRILIIQYLNSCWNILKSFHVNPQSLFSSKAITFYFTSEKQLRKRF